MMDKRIGVVGIVVESREGIDKLNKILQDHAEIIVGRMGIPYKEKGVNVISIVVDGSTDQIGSMTGKIGSIEGITVSTALSKKK